MKEKDFKIIANCKYKIEEGEILQECSSNIALIKYWGKYPSQIPANSSISFTLKNCKTISKLRFVKSDNFEVKVYLNNELNLQFSNKIFEFFKKIKIYFPFIHDFSYEIYTENTFPHSSGIASSASGFGAIAKLLMEFQELLYGKLEGDFKLQKTSFIARLGSGSACRSIYEPLAVWGENKYINGSSNFFAIPYPYEISENIINFNDCILLIHEGQKSFSSSIGHSFMKNHPFSKQRFKFANKQFKYLKPILKEGNLLDFGKLIEQEALMLHAMMMTSSPYYILMKSNTLQVIEKIWEYRENTEKHLYFTLDAGANIHLLYPKNEENEINQFIKNELLKYTQNGNAIWDEVLKKIN